MSEMLLKQLFFTAITVVLSFVVLIDDDRPHRGRTRRRTRG